MVTKYLENSRVTEKVDVLVVGCLLRLFPVVVLCIQMASHRLRLPRMLQLLSKSHPCLGIDPFTVPEEVANLRVHRGPFFQVHRHERCAPAQLLGGQPA